MTVEKRKFNWGLIASYTPIHERVKAKTSFYKFLVSLNEGRKK